MADQADWFGAFVERSLVEAFELEEVVQDEDGDYPFGDGTTTVYVTVEPAPGLGVCVWSYAARGVKAGVSVLREVVKGGVSVLREVVKGGVSVLREVNDLNIQSRLGKVMWHNGVIRVELRLPADQVSAESLERACGHVQGMASDIGEMFAVVHGGASSLIEPQAS